MKVLEAGITTPCVSFPFVKEDKIHSVGPPRKRACFQVHNPVQVVQWIVAGQNRERRAFGAHIRMGD